MSDPDTGLLILIYAIELIVICGFTACVIAILVFVLRKIDRENRERRMKQQAGLIQGPPGANGQANTGMTQQPSQL